MNAEYQSHTRVWEMLKPRIHAHVEPDGWSVWATLPLFSRSSRLFDLDALGIDLEVLAHGHRELTSPLAEW